MSTPLQPFSSDTQTAESPRQDEQSASPASRSASTIPLEITRASKLDANIDVAWLQSSLRRALALVAESSGRPLGQIVLRIMNDAEMIQLNRRFAGADHTTDVLSFDRSDSGEYGPDAIEADIAVCANEAARRAAELGHPIERELLLYGVHGLLHCVGFDDHDDSSFAAMHAEEDRILRAIGVGATFARAEHPGEIPA